MDPDPEAAFAAASQLTRSAVTTVMISTCIFYPISSSERLLVKMQMKNTTKPVVEKKSKAKPTATKKTIYISFDDGPNKGTDNVLQIIRTEKIPVTMFIVGEHIYGSESQSQTWDSLKHCEYIELANHSFTHANRRYDAFYSNPEQVIEDFQRCHDSLGLQNKISRTPGRNIWRTESISRTDVKRSSAAADSLFKRNFALVGWDIEWHFDPSSLELKESPEELTRRIDSAFVKKATRTHNHLVLLAHDQAYADPGDSTRLHEFFRMLKDRSDFELQFINKYPSLRN